MKMDFLGFSGTIHWIMNMRTKLAANSAILSTDMLYPVRIMIVKWWLCAFLVYLLRTYSSMGALDSSSSGKPIARNYDASYLSISLNSL